VTIVAVLTKERMGEYVRAVFNMLKDTDGLPVAKVIERIPEFINLTDFERSTYPTQPGVVRFTKTVRFATIKAVKVGWMVKDKGRWFLTPEGRRAFDMYPDPIALQDELDRLYKVWQDAVKGTGVVPPSPDDLETGVSDESALAGVSAEEAEEAAQRQIESYLQAMNPYEFQHLVAALLRGMGYHVSWVAPPGKDDGVDILAYADPVGAKGPRVLVQVRKKENPTTRPELEAFMANIGDHDVGLFVSLAGFTLDAERKARGQEKRRIMLWDGQRLQELWIEHYLSIPEPDRRRLPLKAVYFLAPSLDGGAG
jgi:restriction system protein